MFIRGLFKKCNLIRKQLRIWPHILKKSVMDNFIPCAVVVWEKNFESVSFFSLDALCDRDTRPWVSANYPQLLQSHPLFSVTFSFRPMPLSVPHLPQLKSRTDNHMCVCQWSDNMVLTTERGLKRDDWKILLKTTLRNSCMSPRQTFFLEIFYNSKKSVLPEFKK